MAIRTLGLIVTNQALDGAALRAAAGIALREDAHLDVRCLAIKVVEVELSTFGLSTVFDAGERADAQACAEALLAWAESVLPRDLRASVEPMVAQRPGLVPEIARVARFCDLVVAGRPYGPGQGALGPLVFEALLFGTGAPVLMVSNDAADWSRPWSRVVLAWNGSDEALRAARSMLPLLEPGAQVDVAIVDPSPHGSDRSDPGGALAAWLARHGVKANVSVLTRTLPRVADVLARLARERGAEALVMGGYGHSPLREKMLGGPTRTLLAEADLPLLLAH